MSSIKGSCTRPYRISTETINIGYSKENEGESIKTYTRWVPRLEKEILGETSVGNMILILDNRKANGSNDKWIYRTSSRKAKRRYVKYYTRVRVGLLAQTHKPMDFQSIDIFSIFFGGGFLFGGGALIVSNLSGVIGGE